MLAPKGNKSIGEILYVMFLVNMYMYASPVLLYFGTIWNILNTILHLSVHLLASVSPSTHLCLASLLSRLKFLQCLWGTYHLTLSTPSRHNALQPSVDFTASSYHFSSDTQISLRSLLWHISISSSDQIWGGVVATNWLWYTVVWHSCAASQPF